jgi:hypothetical protein
MGIELRVGNNPIDNVFSKMTLSIAGWFIAIYLLWHNLIIGFRVDHFNFILVLTLLYFVSSFGSFGLFMMLCGYIPTSTLMIFIS